MKTQNQGYILNSMYVPPPPRVVSHPTPEEKLQACLKTSADFYLKLFSLGWR